MLRDTGTLPQASMETYASPFSTIVFVDPFFGLACPLGHRGVDFRLYRFAV